jgi:hypothetical protein
MAGLPPAPEMPCAPGRAAASSGKRPATPAGERRLHKPVLDLLEERTVRRPLRILLARSRMHSHCHPKPADVSRRPIFEHPYYDPLRAELERMKTARKDSIRATCCSSASAKSMFCSDELDGVSISRTRHAIDCRRIAEVTNVAVKGTGRTTQRSLRTVTGRRQPMG